MFVLYKKAKEGYTVNVEIIAVSNDRDVLERMLPKEVEKHLLANGLDHEDIFRYNLPHGYEPLRVWTAGPFESTKFEVVAADVAY